MQNCIARAVVLLIFILTCVPGRTCAAQMMDDDVDGLQIKSVSPTSSRLTWTAVESVPCEFSITYSVFKSKDSEFEPSPENMIASNLKSPSYLTHDFPNDDTYYHVRAVRHPLYCTPPAVVSGRLFVYPLDLGKSYAVTVGEKTEDCPATSPFGVACKTLPYFHAALAQQAGHEFLIGCLASDFEDGAWSCVNVTTGMYSVVVHSMTLTFINAGFSKQDMRTGRTLSPVIPVFSVLGTIY